jgi:hypothetical protein
MVLECYAFVQTPQNGVVVLTGLNMGIDTTTLVIPSQDSQVWH